MTFGLRRDNRGVPEDADFIVRGFDRHGLLVETWHRGEASKDLEVSVWKTRIDNPSDRAIRVEIVSRFGGKVETYP